MKSGAVTNHYYQVVLVIAAVPCSGLLAARSKSRERYTVSGTISGSSGILMNRNFR